MDKRVNFTGFSLPELKGGTWADKVEITYTPLNSADPDDISEAEVITDALNQHRAQLNKDVENLLAHCASGEYNFEQVKELCAIDGEITRTIRQIYYLSIHSEIIAARALHLVRLISASTKKI